MTLAVDEACANIIKHTYCGLTDKPITARCMIDNQKIEFQLEDCGPLVDKTKIKPRELDELRPGGLGTYFMNVAMDEVIYDIANNPDGCGNLLRLIKYKSGATAGGPGKAPAPVPEKVNDNGDQR